MSSNTIMQNFAQHLQTNGTTNLPAGTLKFLQGLPSTPQPSPWTPPNASAAPGSPSPFLNAVGSQQNQWQPGFFQAPSPNAWWCTNCGLQHINPSSTKCRSCKCPRDPQQALAATQQQQKGKGKGKGTKGKGKGKQQQSSYPTQDQLTKANGNIVWDPAGWVTVARKHDSTSKLILFDHNQQEVDVEEWLLEHPNQAQAAPIAGPDLTVKEPAKAIITDHTTLASRHNVVIDVAFSQRGNISRCGPWAILRSNITGPWHGTSCATIFRIC